MSWVLDIGASSLKLARVGEGGALRDLRIAPHGRPGLAGWVALLAELVPRGQALRIAVPGLVSGGRVERAARLGWVDLDLARVLAAPLGCELALLLSDAEAAGRCAEAELGPERLLAWVLGTGLGGQLREGGELLRGRGLGHIVTGGEGPRCEVCSERGCLESQVKPEALLRRAAELGLRAGSAAELDAHAEAGDERAARVLEAAGRALGEGAARVFEGTAERRPGQVWLAGGVSASRAVHRGLREVWGEAAGASRYGRAAVAAGLALSPLASAGS